MSKRATKRLIIAAIVVGGAVLAIVAIVAILPCQKIASFVIQRAIPDNMKVQSVEGSLLGPLTLRGVTIQTPRAKIHVDRMTADWSPGALFKATVDVNSVIVSGVDVCLRPTNTATTAGQNTGPPKLKPPLSVNLEHIELHNAVIHSAAGKQPFVIKMAVLSGTLTKKKLNIEQLQAHGPLFDLTGHMSIVPDGDYAAAGQLDFKLHLPRYAPASGAVIIAKSVAVRSCWALIDAASWATVLS
jgi:autotransporter translocation and assembly factor TamB